MMLLAIALTLQAPLVAFQDGPREVRVWLEKPVFASEVANRFSITIDGKKVAPMSITTSGEAVRDRVLPRTKGRVILAGTLQLALGGHEWDPDGEVTQMSEASSGVFELVKSIKKGIYEFKVTRDGSWGENYGRDFQPGGSNILIDVPKTGIVKFVVNFNDHTIKNSIENPSEVHAPTELLKQTLSTKLACNTVVLKLAQDVPVAHNVFVIDKDGPQRQVYARNVLNHKLFQYSGEELGSTWTPTKTTFRVWSPVATQAQVVFRDGKALSMSRRTNGTWVATALGNLSGCFYQYRFNSYGQIHQTPDIYCRSASPDSRWSMVVNLGQTNPKGWPKSIRPSHRPQTEAVLYELSVRDFTKRATSGVSANKRGTYAGMVEHGTVVPGTHFKTGIDYLKALGVTDVHLLPTQNFLTGRKDEYTWGYATNLFNVPEETYASQPNKPLEVIREFKQMVQGLHQEGLRVVMDVVYNHTWPSQGKDSAFWETVPYFYARTNDRGDVLNESGVGNALADERPMVRKFVRDSLLYWVREYHVDGFRFDLLGLHNPESVKDWAKALRAVRPDLMLYGEPWTGGGPLRFPKGAQKGTTFAVFNDDFRNMFRGDLDGSAPGFVTGGGGDYGRLVNLVGGSLSPQGFADSPQETINYVSAHDNMTLLDRVARNLPKEQQKAALKLAGASVLLSQGIPFLEGGVEMGRTKGGNNNTYSAGDAVNGFDWRRAMEYTDVIDTYRQLIKLRRSNPGLRLSHADAIKQSVRFLPKSETPPNTVAHRVRRDGKTLFVVLYGGLTSTTLPANSLWPRPVKLAPLSWVVLTR